jgi:outer membrane receptor protein involved in Fe transport
MRIAAVRALSRSAHATTSLGRKWAYAFSIGILIPFSKNPGFALLNLRGGLRLGARSSLTVILENLLDKNYRTMGSGIDGPGINTAVRHSFNF